MGKFELSHAVNLFAQQTAIINNLWTVYVAATFAAASYGATSTSIGTATALAVTAGFLAFTLGHIRLLTQALEINRALEIDLNRALRAGLIISDPPVMEPFRVSIQLLAAAANPPWVSVLIHLFIDVCVVIALWSRVQGISN